MRGTPFFNLNKGFKMKNWIIQWQNSSPQMKMFILTVVIFSALMVVSTAWCYARLVYARNYTTENIG